MSGQRMDDERLRDAWRLSGEGPAEPVEGCPGDEAIWSACRGELSPERVEVLLAHSQECPACAESWAVAASLSGQAGAGARAARPAARSGPRFVWLAAAAVLVLGLVLTPQLLDRSTTAPPGGEFRAPEETRLESLVDEKSPLARSDFVLRWSPGPEGTLYTVEVATEDLTVIHRGEELATGEHRVPESALESIPSGSTVLWHVEAMLPDASRIASPMFRATVE